MKSLPLTLLAGALLVLASAGAAQERPILGPKDGAHLPPTDLERVKVGSLAPDFTLESKDGALITLSSFRSKKDVILVFYRGHW